MMRTRRSYLVMLALALGVAALVLLVGRSPKSLDMVIAARFPEVEWTDTKTLARWMERSSSSRPVVVDARTEEEFNVSHLRGALRVDPDRPDVESLRIPQDTTVVVYCSVGYRSAAIVEQLNAAGLDEVYNLRGGIFAWANEGRPLYRDGKAVEIVHPYDRIWGRLLRRELWAPP